MIYGKSQRSGFTLLEVVVATVILALVMGSLFATFRTATKAYDVGATHAEGAQATRFVVTQVGDDLRNAFYKTEASYNVTRRQREQIISERLRQMELSGTSTDVDEQLPELGPRIDLSFIASDNGEMDELSFVRTQSRKRSEDRKMWGLARVHYFIAGDKLYRSVDDVKAPEVDEDGNEIPKPYPPQIDKIANNIKGFDLKFGYYNEKEWKIADNWDSNATQYRNPIDEDLMEDMGMDPALASASTGGLTSSTEQMKPDDLPAWVEITYVFTDPRKEEKERIYKQVVQLVTSQETYVPPDDSATLNDNRMIDRSERRTRSSGRY